MLTEVGEAIKDHESGAKKLTQEDLLVMIVKLLAELNRYA